MPDFVIFNNMLCSVTLLLAPDRYRAKMKIIKKKSALHQI